MVSTKIESVEGISVNKQLGIVERYTRIYNISDIVRKKPNKGICILHDGRVYHVAYHRTKTKHCFNIW